MGCFFPFFLLGLESTQAIFNYVNEGNTFEWQSNEMEGSWVLSALSCHPSPGLPIWNCYLENDVYMRDKQTPIVFKSL